MKILFNTAARIIGGGETQLKYLVDQLKDEDILITYEHPELAKFAASLGHPSKHIASPNALLPILADFRPDIIQYYHSPTVPRITKKVHRTFKVVEVAHNRHPFEGDFTTYPKDQNDMTVCVSPDVEAYCLSKCPKIPTTVIPNGLDTDVFKPNTQTTPGLRLRGGFTGRLERGPFKGIPTLIETMASFPDVDFELVGQDYDNYARRLPPNIRHLPFTTDVVKHYQSWDFFVSCSPSEGFGLSIAEALACGLPSVIWRCGGICHYLQDGVHAYIVDNQAQLTLRILDIINARASLRPTTADFSAKTMAASYRSLYRSLLNQREVIEVRDIKPVSRLAICPRGWYGVRRVLAQLTEAEIEPLDAKLIRKYKPEYIFLGCYFPSWSPVLQEAQNVGATVIGTWHASYILNEFDHINRQGMLAMIEAYRAGLIHRMMISHPGLAKSFNAMGVKTDWVPNVISELSPVEPLPGINIGLFGSTMPWKNLDCQLAAAALIPRARIHLQKLRHPEILDILGIRDRVVIHPEYIASDADYYKLIGSMTLNMVVSLSETYSYYAAESMMMGVPVVATPIVPVLKGSSFEALCTTPYFEDPIAIADTITNVLTHREKLSPALMTHIRCFNDKNKELVTRWLKSLCLGATDQETPSEPSTARFLEQVTT